MSRPDEGNPRAGYVGIIPMISDARLRQPRDGQMKCGSQSADISMIHRRYSRLPSRSSSTCLPVIQRAYRARDGLISG